MAYERDVLDDFDPRRKPTYPKVVAVTGLIVEDRSSGFCGDVVKTSFEAVTLRISPIRALISSVELPVCVARFFTSGAASRWGDDLRELGIVVEPLHGIDHLVDAVADFEPGPERRLGILVDHLVEGSKEWRLAASVRGPHVLVTGHPFVDVWAGMCARGGVRFLRIPL